MTTPAFELPLGSYVYRPLRRYDTPLQGWDVYALQTAIRGFGVDIKVDGIFGDKTAEAVWHYQESHNITQDGIAGIATQRNMSLALALRFRKEFSLPAGLPRGHIEKECGFQLGNHTPPYHSGSAAGSRDLGIVQCNDRFYTIENAFDVMFALRKLCEKVADRHAIYMDMGNVTNQRAWELAAGAWNAPAFTNWLAGIRDTSALEPGIVSRATIEAYMAATTAYCKWNQ